MKLYHFTILFSILLLVFGSTIVQQDRYRKLLEREKACIDECIDSAVDAAAGHLAVYYDGTLWIDKEKALEVFLDNMYAGLGILDNIPAQQQLVSYIPFLVIVEEDGYYIWHLEQNVEEGKAGYAHYWSPKGFFTDLEENRTVALEGVLEDAIGKYNMIAEEKRVEYSVLLPELDNCLWLRGAEEPGMFVFVQGIPLQYGNQVYSKFSFAGAVIHKK